MVVTESMIEELSAITSAKMLFDMNEYQRLRVLYIIRAVQRLAVCAVSVILIFQKGVNVL